MIDIKEEIKRRIQWSREQLHSKSIYANSDITNYREGYSDSLGELLEWIEDNECEHTSLVETKTET